MASPPFLISNQASGFEDNTINFGIFAQPSQETHYIEVIVSGMTGWLPDLDDPITASGIFDAATSTWTATFAPGVQMRSGPRFTPPDDSDEDRVISVTVNQYDPAEGNALVSSDADTLNAVVDAVADDMMISVGAQNPSASVVDVPVTITLRDVDGSEEITNLEVQGLPTGAFVVGGTPLSGGGFSIDPTSLPDFSLSPEGMATFTVSVDVNAYGGGPFDATLTFTVEKVNLSQNEFNFSNNVSSQTEIVEINAVCFLTGTAIATPDGPRAVETLTPGDAILTAQGRVVPMRFNFHQTIATRFGPAERLMPVRVAKGALGGGLPERDLTLTADHALLVDGLLINAGALVNGTTITRVPLSEFGGRYTVHHIETEAHDLILAEGTPAETYIDYVARRSFDNYGDYTALHGSDRMIPELPLPRIATARMLPPALKARVSGEKAA